MGKRLSKEEGPQLERLMQHLAECPAVFLREPRYGQKGEIFVDAVVGDLLMELSALEVTLETTRAFSSKGGMSSAELRLVLIACWLFHDSWFIRQGRFSKSVEIFLKDGFKELAKAGQAEQFVQDSERREEFVRLALAGTGLLPQGETEAVAADRLRALDTVERSRLVRESAEKMKRARELREALEKKQAAEAADKWNRE